LPRGVDPKEASVSVKDVLDRSGPRKLLALDGGGIRGLITVEVLGEIEVQLRGDRGDAFRLSDELDYIAGTGTGVIIATCLSLRMSAAEIHAFYRDSGTAMFDKASLLRRFRTKFEDEKLAAKLKEVIGPDTTLGSDRLKTLLLIVMRNRHDRPPWPLSNSPHAKYNLEERRRDGLACNLDLPLWQLVRASTAAPTYVPPEAIQAGGPRAFLMVHGGVTMCNNPAFLVFLLATVEPYNLRWTAGRDQMLVVSIGTGTSPKANQDLAPEDMNLIYNAVSIPSALMFAVLNEQDLQCRVFGECRHGDELDRDVGTMIDKRGPADPKLFSYVRYNAELTAQWLGAHASATSTP
jgi:uncharacterized protein